VAPPDKENRRPDTANKSGNIDGDLFRKSSNMHESVSPTRMTGGTSRSSGEGTVGSFRMFGGERGGIGGVAAGNFIKSNGASGNSSGATEDPFSEFDRVVRTGSIASFKEEER
jgi:hypothetical protein